MKKQFEKIIISESQRGLLYQNGKFVKVLSPGAYHTFGGRKISVLNGFGEVMLPPFECEGLLKNPDFTSHVQVVQAEDNQVVLVYNNGNFETAFRGGRHIYWNEDGRYTFRLEDITNPEMPADLPIALRQRMCMQRRVDSTHICQSFEVTEYQKGLLFVNRQFVRLLEPGVHYFWNSIVPVYVRTVDTRLLQLDINGQEMLTKDKVTIRVNLVCRYRIREYDRILLEVDDYQEQLHLAAQMALREYAGRYGLDEILENKDRMSEYLTQYLRKKEGELYLNIVAAGVKDIILPGEIRDIMNTVLIAEKRAQANVITRREEVASTRSLLNTAKLMDENQTLYRLKELEYLEKICEHVGSIHLSGGNVLEQMTALLKGNAS